MKLAEAGSNRHADVFIRADGNPCLEHNFYIDEDDGAYCCYVAIQDGQSIAVDISFLGSTMRADFDLFIDGILRNGTTIKNQTWRQAKRSVKFDTGFFEERHGVIAEGYLKTRKLDAENDIILHNPGKETVGMIEVHISTLRSGNEAGRRFGEHPVFSHTKDWRQEPKKPQWTLIKPTHDIGLTKKTPQPTTRAVRRAAKFARARSDRSGPHPWVVVRFFYRHIGE